jgi:hypothetical protein
MMQSQLLFSMWNDHQTHFAHTFWIFHAQNNASKGVTKIHINNVFPIISWGRRSFNQFEHHLCCLHICFYVYPLWSNPNFLVHIRFLKIHCQGSMFPKILKHRGRIIVCPCLINLIKNHDISYTWPHTLKVASTHYNGFIIGNLLS